MARASRNNGFGRKAGFLSDIVKGEVTVETPSGVMTTSTDMGPYATSLRKRRYPLQTSGISGEGEDSMPSK